MSDTKTIDPALGMWEGRKVMICLPAYQGIEPANHLSLFANYAKYGPTRIGILMKTGTLVDEARNALTHDFMQTDAEWMVACDGDMLLPVGNADWFNGNFAAGVPLKSASFVAIERLMSHPADKRIVGALYFGRHEYGQAQCADGFGRTHNEFNTLMRSHSTTGLLPQSWVAVGFSRIHRSVFEEMKAAIDAGQFPECRPHEGNGIYGYWTKSTAIGEDVMFGSRATKLGIQSYLDVELECLHGSGHSWWGSRNTRNRN